MGEKIGDNRRGRRRPSFGSDKTSSSHENSKGKKSKKSARHNGSDYDNISKKL